MSVFLMIKLDSRALTVGLFRNQFTIDPNLLINQVRARVDSD